MSETDRPSRPRKRSRMVRIRDALITPLATLAERQATSVTEEVNRAIRELLEREHLWPPNPPLAC